jgi:hypothetical protein
MNEDLRNGTKRAGKNLTPLEIMPRRSPAGSGFIMVLAGFNAPLEFLTGFAEYPDLVPYFGNKV